VGINYSAISLGMYKDLLKVIPDKEFIDVSNSILESRKKKTDEELAKLRQAARIGSEIYEEVIQSIKEGMTEYELASKMVYEMMNAGASGPSFSTIVGFGPSSAIPHYSPSDRKLKKGDFVLTDYGALYKGYCSDITRTAVFGRADSKQKEMYNIVKEAQTESMKTIRQDINGKDVDEVARKIIDGTQYKGRFIHSLGHGLGLDVHDHPALARNYDFTLKDRMVVTVEPEYMCPSMGASGLRMM
jgi:Xaa-Pro aminopeptidase